MAVDLTTPIPVADIGYQGITKLDFHMPHYYDDGDTSMKLNKADIVVVFTVTTWDGDGNVIRENRYSETFSGWPSTFTTDVRAVYDRLEQYAISQGYIGAGTGEAL